MYRRSYLKIEFAVLAALVVLSVGIETSPHDLGTTPITWNREISRIFYSRCVSCHHEDGSAFSLMTYRDAQPRAVAIRNAVTSRRMPPWGAVKGFGDFRNDEGLTQEQIELIIDWVESDTPKGNNPNTLPKEPHFEKQTANARLPKGLSISGNTTLNQSFKLDGLVPERLEEGASVQVIADRPDGSIEPLVWIYGFEKKYQHPFLLRRPIDLPSGTIIRGIPKDAVMLLLPKSDN